MSTTTLPRGATPPPAVTAAAGWLVAGSLIGATITAALSNGSTDAAVPWAPAEAHAVSERSESPADAVVISAQAAERWALSERDRRRAACGATHSAPDAVERCTRG